MLLWDMIPFSHVGRAISNTFKAKDDATLSSRYDMLLQRCLVSHRSALRGMPQCGDFQKFPVRKWGSACCSRWQKQPTLH